MVIDECSTIMFGSVPRPHRVVLLGRDEDVNDRQILVDGDTISDFDLVDGGTISEAGITQRKQGIR